MTPDPESELSTFDPATIVDLDVRDDWDAGREPLPRILAAVEQLAQGKVFHLRSPFDPVPLRKLLGRRGYSSHAIGFAERDWSTWFWRADTLPTPRAAPQPPPESADEGILDLRALPPPEPLIVIIERVNASDASFDVLLPFYPEPLVALLEPARRRIVLLENRSDGVVVRIEAPTG
jgi:uncharacterized protein (DUF2249 family)